GTSTKALALHIPDPRNRRWRFLAGVSRGEFFAASQLKSLGLEFARVIDTLKHSYHNYQFTQLLLSAVINCTSDSVRQCFPPLIEKDGVFGWAAGHNVSGNGGPQNGPWANRRRPPRPVEVSTLVEKLCSALELTALAAKRDVDKFMASYMRSLERELAAMSKVVTPPEQDDSTSFREEQDEVVLQQPMEVYGQEELANDQTATTRIFPALVAEEKTAIMHLGERNEGPEMMNYTGAIVQTTSAASNANTSIGGAAGSSTLKQQSSSGSAGVSKRSPSSSPVDRRCVKRPTLSRSSCDSPRSTVCVVE
ncbi:unnamed protein product, partial [Amoebophrya sp. A25]